MTRTRRKPAIRLPDVVSHFRDYLKKNPCWGPLHVVLDDGNLEDFWVREAKERARRSGDHETEYLAKLLLQMSRGQRYRLYMMDFGDAPDAQA